MSGTKEIWKPVPGFEGRYEASNLGRVKSLPNGARKTVVVLKPYLAKRGGYPTVGLTYSKNGRWMQTKRPVHILILEAFIGPRPDRMQACHNDSNPMNNHLTNLRWDTHSSNQLDRRGAGTANRGDRNGSNKLSESDVREIRNRLRRGDKVTHIAKDYGVFHGAIGRIKRGETWGWLS